MKVLIIIPAYNEEENIVRVVEHLKLNYPQYDYVVVNDGSSDRTKEICLSHGYRLISHRANLGLAGAFQSGMKYAMRNGYDAALQFDGDGQHRPEYIAALCSKIEEGYDIAIGSRFVTKKKPNSLRMLGSRLICFAMKIATGKKYTDPTSGMRMYGKRMIQLLANEVNLGPEPDTIAYLDRSGAKITEIQVEMDERIAGKSYLTISRSIQYMCTVSVSILLIGWFRKKLDLGE